MGKAIRDWGALKQKYQDVGALSDPKLFEIAKLLLKLGMSIQNRNCYLRLKQLRGMMPWSTSQAMMQDVDKLPHGPNWTVWATEIQGNTGNESGKWWCCNALECLKSVLGDKYLGKYVQFRAYRQYSSPDRTERVRSEMFTVDWMWDTQDKTPEDDPNGTGILVIISSDKTKLTSFSGNEKAHPVYMTIGKIPKQLRRRISKRANILIRYPPVLKLDCVPDTKKCQVTWRKVFHNCMKLMLPPLEDACQEGVE
ncbi:hypothetical protein FRC12_023290, partial [Ceratobasidium sp. 428]